jgi:hypothetical protein
MHRLVSRAVTAAALTLAVAAFAAPAPPPPPTITVYKDPACGCCTKWVEHLRAAGFRVTVVDTSNMEAIKARFGVTDALASCHTAKAGAYVIEGHVPAGLIQRLLAEHPAVRGLAVPGMVAGSPGMESPNPQHYDVVSFDRDGKTAVYARP